MPHTRPERIAEFYKRLAAAPQPAGHDEALELVASTLNEVEDEFSGVAFDPATRGNDGRLYPPQADSEVACGRADTRAYRTRGHAVEIGLDGSIRILRKDGQHWRVDFEKP